MACANPSFARSILITGSSRGIGYEFVRQFLKMDNGPKYIFATCRDTSLINYNVPNCRCDVKLHIMNLDVTDTQQMNDCKEEVDSIVGKGGLNVLINNAGISCGRGLQQHDHKQMLLHYKTNICGPILMSQIFYPLLKNASMSDSECDTNKMGVHRAAIINLSSLSGTFSVPSNKRGEHSFAYAYDSSKTALNLSTKMMAEELRKDGIATLALHPGWVDTDLGGCRAPLTVQSSVENMIKTMRDRLNSVTSGRLLDYEGKELNF